MYFIIETQISETWKLYFEIFLFKIIALVERSVELLWGNTDNCSLEMLKWQVFTLGILNPVWVTLDLNRAWQVPRFLLALLAPGSCAHTLPLVAVAMTANITCPCTCHANHQNHQKWFHEGGRASKVCQLQTQVCDFNTPAESIGGRCTEVHTFRCRGGRGSR